jgi:DNA-binding CsgD family transcriptional regulator
MRAEDLTFETRNMDPGVLAAAQAMISAFPDVLHAAFSPTTSSLVPYGTTTATLGLTVDQARSFHPLVEYMQPLGICDVIGVLSRDPSGHVIFLTAPTPDVRRPYRSEVATWSRIAAHISAGARLRRALPAPSNGDLAEGADAILSPSGSVTHAEAAAQSPSTRESLRRAAQAIDRARSKARSNEDEALDLWQGLVAGRWSLVDRFDTDGRRLLVARKNDPDVTDPRALTLRERQVLAYAAMGHPLKLIGYTLGIAVSSVSGSRRSAMRKLGLQNQADIVRLFARGPQPKPETPRDN